MPKLIPEIEAWAEGALAAVETKLEAVWQTAKPEILGLGETILGQIGTAALTVVTGGATWGEALASVVGQLPAELKDAEAIVASALGLHVTQAQVEALPPPPAAAA